MWMAGKGFIVYGSSDLRRILRDVERRYSDVFAELGPGAFQDFKSHRLRRRLFGSVGGSEDGFQG